MRYLTVVCDGCGWKKEFDGWKPNSSSYRDWNKMSNGTLKAIGTEEYCRACYLKIEEARLAAAASVFPK